jgi:hypothetical protein
MSGSPRSSYVPEGASTVCDSPDYSRRTTTAKSLPQPRVGESVSEETKILKLLEDLEYLKEQSLGVFETAHRLRLAALGANPDSLKDQREAVVIEFKRFLEKRQK